MQEFKYYRLKKYNKLYIYYTWIQINISQKQGRISNNMIKENSKESDRIDYDKKL